jgi:hypothetical protein
LNEGVVESFEKLEMVMGGRCFSREMTPNTPTEGQPSGLMITTLMLRLSQLNPLTLTQLNTFWWISKILLRMSEKLNLPYQS